MVILVLFGVLPHPAKELIVVIFGGNFRTGRCSHIESGSHILSAHIFRDRVLVHIECSAQN